VVAYIISGRQPSSEKSQTALIHKPKKKENTMDSLNRPSEKVLSSYLEAVKLQFPEIEIDASNTELAVLKIQEVAASTSGELIARLYFKFDLDKATALSILPEAMPPNTDPTAGESGAVGPGSGNASIRPEAISMANDIMSIPKVQVCIEAVANELLEKGEILLPVAWITDRYPEIFGMGQMLENLNNRKSSKRSSKGK